MASYINLTRIQTGSQQRSVTTKYGLQSMAFAIPFFFNKKGPLCLLMVATSSHSSPSSFRSLPSPPQKKPWKKDPTVYKRSSPFKSTAAFPLCSFEVKRELLKSQNFVVASQPQRSRARIASWSLKCGHLCQGSSGRETSIPLLK